jgi:hypothetical protein
VLRNVPWTPRHTAICQLSDLSRLSAHAGEGFLLQARQWYEAFQGLQLKHGSLPCHLAEVLVSGQHCIHRWSAVGSQNQRAQWGPADWSLHRRRQRLKTWSAVLVSFSNPLQRQCVLGVHMLQRKNFVGHA